MASSQIQIPSHALRDHNQGIRDVDRECGSTTRFVFQKNIDELVRDHLSNCWGEKGRDEDGGDARRQQTRVLDRWAANQAKETMKERRKREAELSAIASSQSVSERASTFLRESSPPAQSDSSSVGVPNLHASSLVQRWKEFEAEAISPRANQSNVRFKRMNSTKSNTGSSSVESPMGSEKDYRFDAVDAPEDSGWLPEQVAPSEQHCPSLQRQNSDASERSRVADIVKKLTSGAQTSPNVSPLSSGNENDHECHIANAPAPAMEKSVSHQGEKKDLKKPLRVRGRQATKDLLMQMEQERRMDASKVADRHAVSQFPHRGRIQSLLRLKLLQRGVSVHEQQRPASTKSELDQLHGRSTFVLLREKFSMKSQEGVNVPDVKNLTESLNVKQDSRDDLPHKEDNMKTQRQLLNATHESGYERAQKKDKMKTTPPRQMGIFDHLIDRNVHDVDVAMSEVLELDYPMPSPSSLPSTSEHMNDSSCWTSDVSGSPIDDERSTDDWSPVVIKEGSDVITTQQVESLDNWKMLTVQQEPNTFPSVESTDGSWLNELSYPPRDWECQKESWYDENDSDNVDTHALLERRIVSKLLASGFRDKMERILALHLKKHPEILGGVELEEEVFDHHYPFATDDSDQGTSPSVQLPSPSCSEPWSPDQGSSNNFDQAAYTQLKPNKNISSDRQETQQCSPITTRSSMEMELIYDLKGNIEKLQYEMSELRESIKSCIGMQVQLQNAIKQEVEAAVFRTMSAVQKGEAIQLPSSNSPKMKGNCCVCCSTQVDSLLYRCGHMCTCFKCAQELQNSSSRCPICRAPIVDVVKAYSDI